MTTNKAASRMIAAATGIVMGFGLAAAQAADPVKIGLLTTLSGDGAGLGGDTRDGFVLAVTEAGGKLGGVPVEVLTVDDARKPETAVQAADRLVKEDGVSLMTGIVFSNLALAVVPKVTRDDVIYVSSNAGPSQLAGAGCSPNYFNAAYQNDNLHEATGAAVEQAGLKRMFLIAPNYPAGKDSLTGFKRYYKGEVVQEVYTKLGQLDYAAEIASIRAADPEGVFIFLPGGMGINFVKQFDQAGLKGKIKLYGPAFSFSQDILPAVGDAALGVINGAQWSTDLDNPANKAFVAGFEKAYGRLPSVYAMQGYEAAHIMGAGLEAVGGDVANRDGLRAGMKAAKFDSVRGEFRFGNNQHPIQDLYAREVVKDDQGRLVNRIVAKVFDDHVDAYAADCKM